MSAKPQHDGPRGGADQGAGAAGTGGSGATGQPAAAPPMRRFYETVTVTPQDDGFHVRLDGRPVRTPARHLLALPTEPLADAVAQEWHSQTDVIRPETMPLTRLANSCLDGVATALDRVADDVVTFAGTDLLCYRADGPAGLLERQAAHWDPLLEWAETVLAARFTLAEGVMPVRQSDRLLAAVRARLPSGPFALGAVHLLTTLTGSAIIALAVAERQTSLDEAWRAAHVDEDWNIALWGEDAEAALRRERRWRDAVAAERVLRLV